MAGKYLSTADLERALARGRWSPVWVFVGGSEEEHLALLAKVRAAVVAPGMEGFNAVTLGGAETPAEEVLNAARTKAMGPGGRLVVLREPTALPPAERLLIADYLGNAERDNCLVVVLEGFDRQNVIQARALDAGMLVSFKQWGDSRGGIENQLRGRGIKAAPDAVRLLECRLPEDRGVRARELEKITLYLDGRSELRVEDLEKLLAGAADADLDRLAGEVRGKDLPGALRTLNRLLDEGVEPPLLVGTMAGQYRQLLAARQQGQPGQAREKPGGWWKQKEARKVDAAATTFTDDELTRALVSLREADRLLKSTTLSPAMILEAALLGFLAHSAGRGD